MKLKLTINRERSGSRLEVLEAEDLYANSLYVHELQVEANLLSGREALRASFAIDAAEKAKCVLPFKSPIDAEYAVYAAKIPSELFKGLNADKTVAVTLGVYRTNSDGILSALLTTATHTFTIHENSAKFEESMTDAEREKLAADISALTNAVNTASARIVDYHFGTLITGTEAATRSEDTDLAAKAKFNDVYHNTETNDYYRCTERNSTYTVWAYLGNNRGHKGDKGDIGIGIRSITYNGVDASGNYLYNVVLTNGYYYSITAPRGPKGSKGDVGLQGIQGEKGETGETGRVGPQGKTGEKGEGFSIKKTYPSIEEMNADFSNSEIKEGDFVLIAAESVDIEDNAKLFVKGSNGFKYLVDMSGATGIKGESGVNGVDSLFNGVCTHAAPTIGNAVSFNITEFNRVPIVGDTFYKLQTLDNSTRRWLVLYSVTASDDAAQTVTCLTSDALELGATLEYSKYDFSITESQWSSLYNSTFAAMTTVTLDRAVTSVQYVTPIVNAEMQTKYGIVISDIDGASVTLKAIRKPAETLSISILVEG